ncbi:MAG: hypothetical protein O6939_13405 [Bacteroidetes bacterium]|nr:hypothetical protein [Bacteroidota bacterium]
MKLEIAEIWNFLKLRIDQSTQSISFNLAAADFKLENLSSETIKALKNKEDYHEEVLTSIFINREILWQPNVYDKVEICISNLNIFSSFCQDAIDQLTNSDQPIDQFYNQIFQFLSSISQETVNVFQESIQDSKANVKIAPSEDSTYVNPKSYIPRILGRFRKKAFPVIQVFIGLLPQGNLVRRSALNRMDFAVQVIINQYNLKYSDVIDPFWEVVIQDVKKQTPKQGPPKSTQSDEVKKEAAPKEEGKEAAPKEEGKEAAPKEEGKEAVPKEEGNEAVPKEEGNEEAPMTEPNDQPPGEKGEPS